MDKKKHLHDAKKKAPGAKGKPAPEPAGVKKKGAAKQDNAAPPAAQSGAKKHAGGRPSKLTPKLAANIFLLSRKGLTDAEVAQVVGIDESTITRWKRSPEFCTSLKEAKEESNLIIEQSLFERAAGYETPDEKIFLHEGKPVRVPTKKHYPPDPACIIFFLKNRKPNEWRERIPELSNIADSVSSVLQLMRRYDEKKAREGNKKA